MVDDGVHLAIMAKVKAATKALLEEPDWAANMDIVDQLNGRHSFAEPIARVLRKRIRHWNPTVGLLALCLTETLVKNCHCFHQYVAHPDFIDSMLRELYRKKPKKTLLQKVKVQMPQVSEIAKLRRRDKILLLIESWGKSFAEISTYRIFRDTYENLLRENFRFPHPLKDEISPVFTPAAKPRVLPDTDTSGPIKDYGLQNVLGNVELFMDTLNESGKKTNLRTDDAIQALHRNLVKEQQEIMERINNNPSEELMVELLAANDEICQAMNFYNGLLDGTVKRRKKGKKLDSDSHRAAVSKSRSTAKSLASTASGSAVEDLLGLNEVVTPTNRVVSESEASYDTASGSDSSEDESGSDGTDSEEDSDEEEASSEEELSALNKAVAVLAPPPSSGKGKSRRGHKYEQSMLAVDPWVAAPSTTKIELIDDDPFGDFTSALAVKQIAGPPAPLQIMDEPARRHQPLQMVGGRPDSHPADDFLQIALRDSNLSSQQRQQQPVPAPQFNSLNLS